MNFFHLSEAIWYYYRQISNFDDFWCAFMSLRDVFKELHIPTQGKILPKKITHKPSLI